MVDYLFLHHINMENIVKKRLNVPTLIRGKVYKFLINIKEKFTLTQVTTNKKMSRVKNSII